MNWEDLVESALHRVSGLIGEEDLRDIIQGRDTPLFVREWAGEQLYHGFDVVARDWLIQRAREGLDGESYREFMDNLGRVARDLGVNAAPEDIIKGRATFFSLR